ncbi:MAG: transposase [Lachnospiraceae bacterium]|nr:transposase [Lachnospiraceae bacterium]
MVNKVFLFDLGVLNEHRNPQAFSIDLIKLGISYCADLFSDKNYPIIFLADRWFPNINVLSHIQSLGCFYCIRSKSFFTFSYYNSKHKLVTSHLNDISPLKHSSRVFKNVFYTRAMFPTNIVVSRSLLSDDTWYLVTNDNTSRAVHNYSYRFGSIESIFKSQKSNGFRLESTNTQKIEHFISLFTILCVSLVWLTVIGVDYSKCKNKYSLKIRDTRKHSNHSITRLYSFFNLGLTIFNLCYYNTVDFDLKFNFVLLQQV